MKLLERHDTSPHHLAYTCLEVATRLEARLATMVGYDDRANGGGFRLEYIFAVDRSPYRASRPDDRPRPGGWVVVETTIEPRQAAFRSVTPRLVAAHWYEREVHDLLGLTPEDHPDLRPLVLHDDWPPNAYPLRKDFDPNAIAAAPTRWPADAWQTRSPQPVPRIPGEPYRYPTRLKEGIIEIPVGPIHAGVIEPGHFRFAAVGERVLHLEPRLFYTHRGIEKVAEGKSLDVGLEIAQRVCGVCAASHAVSYCLAVEAIADIEAPPRAQAIRTIGLELERLYNHIGDIGNVCSGAALAIGAMQGGRLKDLLQQLNERLVGNRYLRGLCRLGGVRLDLDDARRRDALATLRRVRDDFDRLVDIVGATESFIERMVTTGIVSTETAAALGAVGVAARASDLRVDARYDHPHLAYDALKFGHDEPATSPGSLGSGVPMARRRDGDVRARVEVRIDEAYVSFRLLEHLLENLPSGALVAAMPDHLPAFAAGFGATESPRGENIHWVRVGADGLIDRYRIRSASYPNWPVVAASVPGGNMVPDFPIINKSFELCYSCLDR